METYARQAYYLDKKRQILSCISMSSLPFWLIYPCVYTYVWQDYSNSIGTFSYSRNVREHFFVENDKQREKNRGRMELKSVPFCYHALMYRKWLESIETHEKFFGKEFSFTTENMWKQVKTLIIQSFLPIVKKEMNIWSSIEAKLGVVCYDE